MEKTEKMLESDEKYLEQKFSNMTLKQVILEEKISNELKRIEAKDDEVHLALQDTLGKILTHMECSDKTREEQSSETNSRIDELDLQTKFFRWIHRNPIPAVIIGSLSLMGFIFLGGLVGWKTIIENIVLKGII